WIQKLATRLLLFGSIADPKLRKRGTPGRFNDAMKDELEWILISRPSYYLEEIQEYFLDKWDEWFDKSTICRKIKSLDFTHKRLQFIAAQRDEEERRHWFWKL